jgi:hypothetical protein
MLSRLEPASGCYSTFEGSLFPEPHVTAHVRHSCDGYDQAYVLFPALAYRPQVDACLVGMRVPFAHKRVAGYAKVPVKLKVPRASDTAAVAQQQDPCSCLPADSAARQAAHYRATDNMCGCIAVLWCMHTRRALSEVSVAYFRMNAASIPRAASSATNGCSKVNLNVSLRLYCCNTVSEDSAVDSESSTPRWHTDYDSVVRFTQ